MVFIIACDPLIAAGRHEIRLSLSTKQFAAMRNIYSIGALRGVNKISTEIFLSEIEISLKLFYYKITSLSDVFIFI